MCKYKQIKIIYIEIEFVLNHFNTFCFKCKRKVTRIYMNYKGFLIDIHILFILTIHSNFDYLPSKKGKIINENAHL